MSAYSQESEENMKNIHKTRIQEPQIQHNARSFSIMANSLT